MSAAARKRISDAAKARWAARKGASTAKSTPPKKTSFAPAKAGGRRMSMAARKRMSEMMKARWAARKKAAAKK
jgi:putative heme iron utilization protein